MRREHKPYAKRQMLNEDILNVFTFDSACFHIVVTTDIIVERT